MREHLAFHAEEPDGALHQIAQLFGQLRQAAGVGCSCSERAVDRLGALDDMHVFLEKLGVDLLRDFREGDLPWNLE